MKLLAVNIRITIKQLPPKEAIERAWRLNESKLNKYKPDFIIGVESGNIRGYFKIENSEPDYIQKRVKFKLIKCTVDEETQIKSFINGKKIKYFTVKYKW